MSQHVQHGVEQGCLVAASATPGMVVTIGADTPGANSIINGNVSTSLATTSVVIAAADSTQDRYDLISANSAGVVTATTGALGSLTAATCQQPDTTDVKLGYVPVAAGVTAINASDVQDIRTFVLIHASPYQVSGLWYGVQNLGRSDVTWANNEMYLVPYFVAKTFSIQAIGLGVNGAATAGSKGRLGIYFDDGAGALSLLVDAGQVALDVAASYPSLSTSQTLTPGWWWFACAFQSLGVTKPGIYLANARNASPVGATVLSALSLQNSGSYGGIRYTGISGALPAAPSSPDYSTTAQPAVWFQVA